MKGVTNKIKTRKKKAGYLSDSYIKRLIGPIAKSEPDYRKMLRALKARASDERSKAIRAAARKWCQSHALERQAMRQSIKHHDEPGQCRSAIP